MAKEEIQKALQHWREEQATEGKVTQVSPLPRYDDVFCEWYKLAKLAGVFNG